MRALAPLPQSLGTGLSVCPDSMVEHDGQVSKSKVHVKVPRFISGSINDRLPPAYQGAPARIFEQKLEGEWEEPTDDRGPK